jgi:hypothetical protein
MPLDAKLIRDGNEVMLGSPQHAWALMMTS